MIELNKRESDKLIAEILKSNKALFGKVGHVRLNNILYNKVYNRYKHNSKFQKWYLYIRDNISPYLLKQKLKLL